MDITERVAKAMFEAPDPTEPNYEGSQWPPPHPDDLAWWMNLAQAAVKEMT